MRTTLGALAAALTATLTLTTAPATTTAHTTPATTHTPTKPARLWTPPANPDAHRQIAALFATGHRHDAMAVLAMTLTPQAVWYGDQTPAQAEADIRATVTAAARDHALPVLTLYNIPGRDCSNYSAGGAADTAEYIAWTDAVARGIGNRPALVVLEPDSLALLPSDCGQDDTAGTRTAARYTEVAHAVHTLEPLPATRVYLDTGHATWHPVGDITTRLIQAGITDATGFYTNASNYQSDDANTWYSTLISSCLAYADTGGNPADCPNQWWPRDDAQNWLAAHVHTDPAHMKHYVTDTSRNGQGPWTPPVGNTWPDPQDWCNPPDRGLGARPTTRTGDPLHDARLWIKTPGESDGLCLRGTPGPTDPARGTVDPPAGQWFPAMALELARGATPFGDRDY